MIIILKYFIRLLLFKGLQMIRESLYFLLVFFSNTFVTCCDNFILIIPAYWADRRPYDP